MLKPKALTQVLSQANTGSVIGTMLLNKEGVLLAYSGYGEGNACVTGAMVSSIWGAYERHGQDLFNNDSLQMMLFNCEEGKVGVRRVADLLLCICTKESTRLGLLKAKLEAVAEYLDGPLRQVSMT